MGIDDRDYMRKQKVSWDASRGEKRRDEPEPPAAKPTKAWLPQAALALGAAGVLGAGVWWYRTHDASKPDKTASAEVTQVDEEPASAGEAASVLEKGEPAVAARDKASCRIKGNISGKGKKVYHVPGSRFYAQTEIETAAGERWFCTEEEAIAAGWRAPK